MCDWLSLFEYKDLGKPDIAKINRKYKCPEEKYYVGNDIKGAVPNEEFQKNRKPV